jgi:hypothetical protein
VRPKETLDTCSDLMPDSDDRTREAIAEISTGLRPSRFRWSPPAPRNRLFKRFSPTPGENNKISPSSGLVKGPVSKGLDIGLTCTSAGAGALWAAQKSDAASGAPAALVELSQADLSEIARETLLPGASPGAV